MVSVLVEDLPAATADFFHRRASRTGAASVAEHVRLELVTFAREPDPIDQVVQFQDQNYERPPQPEIDHHAMVMARTYDLPPDVWNVLCRRAAASGVAVSDYAHQELVGISRHGTIDDAMWELREVKAADPSLDVDFEAVEDAIRYARGLD